MDNNRVGKSGGGCSVLLRFFLVSFFILFLAAPTAFGYAKKTNSNLAIFIYGLPGTGEFRDYFQNSWQQLSELLEKNGYDSDQIVRFSEKPNMAKAGGGDYINTKHKIKSTIEELAKANQEYDDLFVFVAGHANGRDEKAKFHITHSDISYEELMNWLKEIKAKRIIVVVAAPQGHVWIKEFSGPNHIIIIGNGLREFDMIPKAFLKAFPDVFGALSVKKSRGKPEQVSLKNAFIQAQYLTQAWYELNQLHPTELAFIDDDGDGEGKSYMGIIARIKKEMSASKVKKSSADDKAEDSKELADSEFKEKTPKEINLLQTIEKINAEDVDTSQSIVMQVS